MHTGSILLCYFYHFLVNAIVEVKKWKPADDCLLLLVRPSAPELDPVHTRPLIAYMQAYELVIYLHNGPSA